MRNARPQGPNVSSEGRNDIGFVRLIHLGATASARPMVRLLGCLVVPFVALTAQPARMQMSIDVGVGGPPILATGDTLALMLRRYECHADVCELIGREAGRVGWTSNAPGVASIDARGILRGRSAGQAQITARAATGWTYVDVRVLPPVHEIAWSLLPTTFRVGDTVRAMVLARDRRGQVVARIAPVAHIGGTGATGEVLWPPAEADPPIAKVLLRKPGMLVLVARLAHRVDTARVRIR